MRFLATLAAVVIAISTAQASEHRGVGEAIAVVEVATASGQIGDRALTPGAKIFVGDRVTTLSTGRAEIRFSDDTRVVVGSNASMTFEELRMNSNVAGSDFKLKLGGGAFRFISGRTPSKGYRIRTPDATISPRGTALEIAVTESLRSWMMLLHGAAQLCDVTGECVETEEQCGVLRTNEMGVAEALEPGELSPDEIRGHFPYLEREEELDPRFRVADHGCAARRGGLAKFSLSQPGLRTPVKLFLGAAAFGGALCALACGPGGTPTPSTIQTTSNTN